VFFLQLEEFAQYFFIRELFFFREGHLKFLQLVEVLDFGQLLHLGHLLGDHVHHLLLSLFLELLVGAVAVESILFADALATGAVGLAVNQLL